MTVPEKGIIIALALLANLALGQSLTTRTFTFGVVGKGASIIHTAYFQGFHNKAESDQTITPTWYTYDPPKEKKHKIGALVFHDYSLEKVVTPALYSGGPRATTAVIRLTTRPNHKFNITLLIYGAPPASTDQSCYHINLADLKDEP